MEYLFPAFRRTKDGQHVFSEPTVSQVTLIQNDQYTKNGIFWNGIFAPLCPQHVISYDPAPAFSKTLSNKFSQNSLSLMFPVGNLLPTDPHSAPWLYNTHLSCYIWNGAQIYSEVCLPHHNNSWIKFCFTSLISVQKIFLWHRRVWKYRKLPQEDIFL